MSARLVLFDFDGVLCDSRHWAIHHVEELRARPEFAGLPSPKESGHFGDLYRGELRSSLQAFGLSDEDSQSFFSSHASLMREHSQELQLFQGVAEGLNSLPSNSYSVISSAYGDVIRRVLTRGGVVAGDTEIIGHEVRETKTEKARSLLARRGLSVDEAVYVGDMESDIEYCRALGLRCIAVSYGYHPRPVLAEARPFSVVDSPETLFELLREELSE